jgi:hypothetical protein
MKFKSMAAFSAFVDTRAKAAATLTTQAAELGSLILYANVIKVYGSPLLAPLSEATQADRISKGFSPNEPLLRDGTLLRDKEEVAAVGSIAVVGNEEIISLFHELGYINSRTGKAVPARPVHLLGLEASAPEVEDMMLDLVAKLLG